MLTQCPVDGLAHGKLLADVAPLPNAGELTKHDVSAGLGLNEGDGTRTRGLQRDSRLRSLAKLPVLSGE